MDNILATTTNTVTKPVTHFLYFTIEGSLLSFFPESLTSAIEFLLITLTIRACQIQPNYSRQTISYLIISR